MTQAYGYTVSYEDFLPYVTQYVPDASEFMAIDAIKQAAILITTDFLKVRGDNSLTMAITTRASGAASTQSNIGSDIELAKHLLSPFRRMR